MSGSPISRQIPPPSAAERNAWARSELKLPEEATALSARRRFFERLKETEFVPPDSCIEAWDQLESEGTTSEDGVQPIPLAFAWSRPRQLLADVEEFAQVYFALAIPERESRYRRLAVECQSWPTVQARLQLLRSALKLNWPSTENESEDLRQLLGWIRELYVLPSLPATARRQTILASVMASGINPMKTEARRLRERFGECRALLPGFVEALDKLMPPVERQEPIDAILVGEQAFPYSSQWVVAQDRPFVPKINPVPHAPPPSGGPTLVGVVGTGVVLGMLCLIGIAVFSTPPNKSPKFPNYSQPPIRGGSGALTPEELEGLRRASEILKRREDDVRANPNRPLFNPSDPTRPISPDEVGDPSRFPFAPRPTNPMPSRPSDPMPRVPTEPSPASGGQKAEFAPKFP